MLTSGAGVSPATTWPAPGLQDSLLHGSQPHPPTGDVWVGHVHTVTRPDVMLTAAALALGCCGVSLAPWGGQASGRTGARAWCLEQWCGRHGGPRVPSARTQCDGVHGAPTGKACRVVPNQHQHYPKHSLLDFYARPDWKQGVDAVGEEAKLARPLTVG